MPDLTHPDELVGALSRVMQVLRPRVENTIDRVGAYEGLSLQTLFPAPGRLPTVTHHTRWRIGGVESEDLSFTSLHEPIEPAFRRYYHARRRRIHTVYARRIRRASGLERPRLLYIHGYMQPETLVEELALLATMAAALDMEVVQLQPPYHGRRKPKSSRLDGDLFWTGDVVRSIESLRQTVFDARTLLAWMRAESARPVGISGLSLGGAFTAGLTCLEPGFAFSAPLIAHMDLGALVAHAPVLGAMREDLARFGWQVKDFARFIARLGWDKLEPVIPTERIHLFAAKDDRFFHPNVVRAMWRRWDRPRIRWYPGSHMGFLPHLPDAIGRLRRFVDALDLR
jgi:dienelactone hydrolase